MTQALTYKLDPAEWAEIVQEDATEPVQVRETTTTTGTGPLTLAGAVAGFQAAAAVYAVGDVFNGAVTDGEDWEYGQYTYTSGNAVARSRIEGSTDGGDAINWGAGTKTFIANVPDAQIALRFLLLELAAESLKPGDVGVTVQAHDADLDWLAGNLSTKGRELAAAADAAAVRTAAGAVIGTNVQAWSANLDEYAAVNPTPAGLALLDDSDAAAQLATLGIPLVENTALSTWAGSGNITAIGTLVSGTVPVARISGILPGANGGTNNGFMDFTGPATSLKTFTLPNASATILTSNAAVTVPQGGTGLVTLAASRIPYGNGTSAFQSSANATFDGNLLAIAGSAFPQLSISGANAGVRMVADAATLPRFEFWVTSARKWLIFSDATDRFVWKNNSVEMMSITQSGEVNFAGKVFMGGATAPTARLHIAAGAAAASTAPVKIPAGTNNTVAEVGALERATDKMTIVIETGTARKEFALCDIALTAGRVSYNTTNGRQTDLSGFEFDGTYLKAPELQFGTHSAIGAETLTGYIPVKDTLGNTRKVAVIS